jgi:hypothetical protein
MTVTVAFMGADNGADGGKRIIGKQCFRGFPQPVLFDKFYDIRYRCGYGTVFTALGNLAP